MFKNIFLCLVSAFLLNACEKTTYLNGKVVNKVTGEPVSGAAILIQVHNSKASSTNEYTINVLGSDNNGDFSFSENLPFGILEIRHKGFLNKHALASDMPVIESGELNNVNINLVPKDGILKLHMKNNSNKTDTLYTAIVSSIYNNEYDIAHGIVINGFFSINANSSIDSLVSLASDEFVKIYWGFEKRPLPILSEVQLAPHLDSVYVLRGDTSFFAINF